MTIVERIERRMEIAVELMHLNIQLDFVLDGKEPLSFAQPLREKIAALEKECKELKR